MTMMSKFEKAHSATGPSIGLEGSAFVRTPCGARRVEFLRRGDLIVTRDNGLQPVRMVWTRTVTGAEIAADPSLAPVCLKPRSIGPMMPQRDLILAPAHRVLVPGWRLADMPDDCPCLIAARDIADASDKGYVDKAQTDITFYNIVFEDHQVFTANGLPVESYLPSEATVDALDEGVGRDIEELFASTSDAEPGYPSARYSARDLKGAPLELV